MIDIDQLEHLVPGYTLTDLNLTNTNDTVTVTLEFKSARYSLMQALKGKKQMSELEPFLKKSYD